jgi:hypothetical protein
MKPGVFREEYIAIIVRELLRGLEYLHTEGKLHRDIKGQAFMLLKYTLADTLCSREHSSFRWRGSQTRGFWRFWPTIGHIVC